MTLYLIARVADRTVAISTDQVESVVDIGAVVPVPGAPPSVRGLAALRSRLVTVISSRSVLDAPTGLTVPNRAVITVVDGHHYAILVNELEDVAELTAAPVGDLWPASSPWRGVARGVIDRDGEPILALDLAALIPGHAQAA